MFYFPVFKEKTSLFSDSEAELIAQEDASDQEMINEEEAHKHDAQEIQLHQQVENQMDKKYF